MKLRSLRKNNNAALAYFMVFVFAAFTLITLFALFSPMMIDMNTAFYEAGENILDGAVDKIQNIQDEDVKTAINESVENAKDSTADQIAILAGFFQYAWIFIIIVVVFVIFIVARSNVEVGIR